MPSENILTVIVKKMPSGEKKLREFALRIIILKIKNSFFKGKKLSQRKAQKYRKKLRALQVVNVCNVFVNLK